jgi:adenosylcobinamide-GDP ribazoletransferase
VVLAYFLPYANPSQGLGEAVAKKVKVRELVGATAFLAIVVFLMKGAGTLCFLALLPFLAGAGFLFAKRVGGITGDLLGAASEAAEVFVLLILFVIKSGSYQ